MFHFLATTFLIPLVAICAIGLIVFLSYYFSVKQIVLRKLSKIPHKPIGSLKTNELTKVSGKALHVKEPLIAPYSQRKCIFYIIKIQQKKAMEKVRIGEQLLVK